MSAPGLTGGFSDPSRQSAMAFRSVLRAMSRPGTIEAVSGGAGPRPLSVAASVVALTLFDHDTSIFLGERFDTDAVRSWLSFQTGARIGTATQADFALGCWSDFRDRLDFPVGTPDYPDRSTTLIVDVPELETTGARLSGPGIETMQRLSLPEIDRFRDNAVLFPLGLDFIFTCGDRVAALPRTTRVEAA